MHLMICRHTRIMIDDSHITGLIRLEVICDPCKRTKSVVIKPGESAPEATICEIFGRRRI